MLIFPRINRPQCVKSTAKFVGTATIWGPSKVGAVCTATHPTAPERNRWCIKRAQLTVWCRFLEAYRRDGLVTVVPWSLPLTVDVWPPRRDVVPGIHYFGQLAALNDCLYRCLGRSSLAVFTDLDEILVPRAERDWTAMLDSVSRRYVPGPGSPFPGVYLFRSSFFRTDWPSDEEVPRAAVDRHLVSVAKTWRETRVYGWFERSKFVVWTKAVTMVGVHSALATMPGADTVQVDADVGLVHHYRLWFDDDRNPPLTDRSMHRFTDDIVARVLRQYSVVDYYSGRDV